MSHTRRAQQPGRCPGCQRDGFVGDPCREPVCDRRGWHLIPVEHVERLAAAP